VYFPGYPEQECDVAAFLERNMGYNMADRTVANVDDTPVLPVIVVKQEK
jgi:hypothetical protein